MTRAICHRSLEGRGTGEGIRRGAEGLVTKYGGDVPKREPVSFTVLDEPDPTGSICGKKERKVALEDIVASEAVMMTLRPVMPNQSKVVNKMSPGTAEPETSALLLVPLISN